MIDPYQMDCSSNDGDTDLSCFELIHLYELGLVNTVTLFVKRSIFRPSSPGFFDVQPTTSLGTPNLTRSLQRPLAMDGAEVPNGCYYGSHNGYIGGFHELFPLSFPRDWTLHRLDWASELLFRVYMESTIVLSAESSWFIAHLRPTQ